jgi:hypothetical protein
MLASRIGVAREQDLFLRLRAGHEDENRVFLLDAGEIQQVAVLPVLVVHIGGVHARRRAPGDEHGVRPERLHRARAPRGQVGDELRGPAVRRDLAGQGQ